MYVGRATNLRSRVGSYWGDLKGRGHLRRMVPQIARVEALECASVHEAAWLERNLLTRARPRWNRSRGGQEVVVWVGLDERPRQAGVRITHDMRDGNLRYFGPYLGADKTALLVSALHRVIPVHSARAGLSGSEREMAATRGVEPGHLDELIARATCILSRDPAAVALATADLLERRAKATADLAFEVAGRITEELAALTWGSGAQRVTSVGGEAQVHGWAGGILVSLEICDGRMSCWRQRQTTEAAARKHLDRTPAEWVEFAQGNAELAARLLG